MKRLLTIMLIALSSTLFAQDYLTQVRTILNAYPFGEPDDGQLKHTIYSFPLDNGQTVLLTFSRREMDNCHACGTQMSIFVIDNGKIANTRLNVDTLGSWGDPPQKQDIFVSKQGYGYIIGIKGVYTAQGYTEEYTSFYYLDGNNFWRLGSVQTYSSNEGAIFDNSDLVEWQAKYSFIPRKDDPPDLLIIITGKDKGKPIHRSERYTVRNGKYVKI